MNDALNKKEMPQAMMKKPKEPANTEPIRFLILRKFWNSLQSSHRSWKQLPLMQSKRSLQIPLSGKWTSTRFPA